MHKNSIDKSLKNNKMNTIKPKCLLPCRDPSDFYTHIHSKSLISDLDIH